MKKEILKIIIPPLVHIIIRFLWLTCKVVRVSGHGNFEKLNKDKQTCIICYWHQHHIFGTWYMRQLVKQGMNIGFLISPSEDGDMSAKLANKWGFRVIRGSSHRTGAKAMRDLFNVITKVKISPVNTSDGPTGPLHVFKPGAIMLAQLTGAPIVLFSYSADRYWKLKSWDEFIIPKPFSKISIAISEPVYINKKITADEIKEMQDKMQNTLQQLAQESKQTTG